MTDDWTSYLESFHGDRPGITEALLERCLGPDGNDPYQWVTRPVPGPGPAVDLGCGSAPTADLVGGWLGIDASRAELGQARARGRGPLVVASVDALPVAADAATRVLAAMSLMVVADPAAVLGEVARILGPGGRLAVLVPADGPLRITDRIRYGMLLATLGRAAMPFPQADLSRRLSDIVHAAGFEVTSDEQVRFRYPMRQPADSDRLVDSLYLPGISLRRVRAARAVARRWGHGELGIPLRRLVAERPVSAASATVSP